MDLDSEEKEKLNLAAVIGFQGSVPDGLILHPNNEDIIYSIGSAVIKREILPRKQHFLLGHDDNISALAVSRSGKYIASGQSTHMGFPADVIIWDHETNKEKHRLSLHKGGVQAIAFSPPNPETGEEKYVVTLGQQDDNAIVMWDLATGEAICGTPAFTDTANFVRFYNHSDTKLISGGNYHIRTWDLDLEQRKLRPHDVKMNGVRRLATKVEIDDNDKFAYIGTTTGDIQQVLLRIPVRTSSWPSKKEMMLKNGGVTCLRLCPNKTDLLVGSGDGKLRRLELRADVQGNISMVEWEKVPLLGAVTSISPTIEGAHFFVGTADSNMYWVAKQSLNAELRNTCHKQSVTDIAFCHGCSKVSALLGGRRFASGTR